MSQQPQATKSRKIYIAPAAVKEKVEEKQWGFLRVLRAGETKDCQVLLGEKLSRASSKQPPKLQAHVLL